MAEGHRRDVAAYSDLVTARSPSLFRTAYLMVGDHQLAQDLLQESLVKTYVAWSRLRDVAKAEAYARRTIVNTAISWRRRRSFHERPVDVMPDVGVADRVDELATRDALWAQLQLCRPDNVQPSCSATTSTCPRHKPPRPWGVRSGRSRARRRRASAGSATGWARRSLSSPRRTRG